MVKISKDSFNTSVSVRGTPAEMMFFYCAWQGHLWPSWLLYKRLGDLSDDAARQHMRTVKSINAGHDLLLSNNGEKFQQALDFAIERSRMLDIEVELD